MRLEKSDFYTIPMPTAIQMKASKNFITIEIGELSFKYSRSKEEFLPINSWLLKNDIFDHGKTIEVSYEDPYDQKKGEKLFFLNYDKNLNWIELRRKR